jgi:phage terminase large subunit
MGALQNHKFILYSGAFGAGKTILLCNAIITQALQYPKSRWLIGCQTYPMLRDTVIHTFFEELELYQKALQSKGVNVILTRAWNKSETIWHAYNGSEILFRSCEDPSKFKSLNLDGFGLDEPVDIDESIFLMLQGRLRGTAVKNQIGLLTGNPAGYTSWVYQYFFGDKKRPGYIAIETSTYDNIFLPSQYIKSMEDSYDADYTRRYLQGKWGDFEGLIYKDFKKEKHVGDFSGKVFKYHIVGYDDGYRNPACLLIGGVDADNKLTIIHEYYKKDRTNDEIANDIKPSYEHYQVRKMFCDPSGLNAIETFKRKGMRAEGADNTRIGANSGISKLKSLFKQDIIHIDKSCKNLILQLESYRYEKDKKTGNYNEEPVKKDDHAVDALRYMVTEYDPFKHFVLPHCFDFESNEQKIFAR